MAICQLTGLSPAEITAWQNATQNTIVVFANGNDGLNTGQIRLYSDAQMQNSALSISNSSSSGLNANIPSFRGSYPVIIDSSLSGEWLTVVAVDQSNRQWQQRRSVSQHREQQLSQHNHPASQL